MIFFDYNLSNNLNQIDLKRKQVINTINPHSFLVAEKDVDFKSALVDADVLLPDGIGIVMAMRFLNGKKIGKIAGYDVFLFLMNQLNEKRGTCYFFGASNETLSRIRKRAKTDFPNVKVETYSPPYKNQFAEDENQMMISNINKISPDVLFVGMTAPKQEKWVHKNKEKINANVICSIGAVFDFYAETIKRPHPFWIKLGLEWFIRSVKQPSRLGKRNANAVPKFLLYILKTKFKNKKTN